MLLIKYITITFTFLFTTAIFATCKNDILICYGKLNPKDVSGYKYVILESEHYSKADVAILKQQNKLVLCYISLGEINEQAKSFLHFKDLVTDKNELWNSYYLNLKSSDTKLVLKNIIAAQLEKGFDGLFLDNIDNYGSYGKQYAQRFDLVEFLSEIRALYPSLYFMQNAGLQLIESTSGLINAIAFESVASDYDFKDSSYKLRKDKAFKSYLDSLKQLERNYKLPIILIEYADDYSLYKRIKSRIKHTKWSYFIGKIDLQTKTNYSN